MRAVSNCLVGRPGWPTNWRRWLLAGLIGWLTGNGLPAVAQSSLPGRVAWQYELQVGAPPRPAGQDFSQLIQLSPTRFLATGAVYPLITSPGYVPQFLFISPNGDTSTRRSPTLPYQTTFKAAVAHPDKSFTAFTGDGDSAGRSGVLLWHFDSLGTPGWQRAIEFSDAYGPMGAYMYGEPILLPDGYLINTDYISLNPNLQAKYGCVIKTDRRGNPMWHIWADMHEWFGGYAETPIAVCPNGSYVVVPTSVSHIAPPRNVWDRDWHLWRITPSGDTVQRTYFGHKRTLERAMHVAATPDNGVLVCGDRTVYAAQPQRRPVAYVVKFDSLFQMQWQVRRVPNYPIGGAAFQSIYPLNNGHYMGVGYTAVLDAGSATDYHYEGLYAEIAPPTSPTDTVGTIVGEWIVPQGDPQGIIPQPGDSTAYVHGYGSQNVDGRTYFAKLTGLVPPLDLQLCAHPPRLGQPPTWQMVNNRLDSLRFTLDPLTTVAGPRYGEVSLVTWDFGDGSPTREGWTVDHRYALPVPVRVRVCATNNLGCATCATLEPYGPVGVSAEELAASVSVFPNPSASGQFTVRAGGGPETRATFTVFDAVGRTVAAGALSGAETALDLRAQAAGVYALRLTWADGRAVSKRLVRW